jgi:nitrile hydratase accessory protein
MQHEMTLLDPGLVRAALAANPSLPVDADGPVFQEPWEAQAFAMALALHQKGVFAWSEWADELGAAIKAAQAAGDPDTGETYYRHWLATLETVLQRKGVSTASDLLSYRDAWERAAARTPHGQPIELQKADFGD